MINAKLVEKQRDKYNWEMGYLDDIEDLKVYHSQIVEQIAALHRQGTAVNNMLDPNFPPDAMTDKMQSWLYESKINLKL
jgi:hypothetical protein